MFDEFRFQLWLRKAQSDKRRTLVNAEKRKLSVRSRNGPPDVVDAIENEARTKLVLLDDEYTVGLVTDVAVQVLFTHAAYDLGASKLLPPGPFDVRAKFNIIHRDGWLPDISLVPWVFLPVAPSETLRAGPYVFWAWELPAHFELEMNAGILFGANPKPRVAPVLASALTYTVVPNFGVFVDIYTTGPDAALGTGMLWAFARDMQIDLGTYVGVHGEEPVATPFLGFSIRQ